MNKKGILLLNLGTPDKATAKAVREYLNVFLNDPRVVDLPALLRKLLVNFLIIPLRYKKTLAAYQKIWEEKGSPLLLNSQLLCEALQAKLSKTHLVQLGMRYGKPSIGSALEKLKGVSELKVIPLFPQYSSAATGSAIERLFGDLSTQWNIPTLHIVRDFYNYMPFIEAYAKKIAHYLQMNKVDQLVFSYHGLPERHIQKSNCKAVCNHVDSCPAIDHTNHYCYRAQCYETSRLIASRLSLDETQYTVSFQSRLGRTPWIKPYTDVMLPTLIKKGMKRIAVVCPSFVADCLETLEEVDIRTRHQWQQLGGDHFTFIPCLNADPAWVDAMATLSV